MQTLTDRQQQVLDIITAYIERHGTPPSQREIARELGVNGTAGIMKHLNALEKKGYLNRRERSSRGIILPQAQSQAASLPIVGVVRAGLPQPPVEDIEGFFSIDQSQAKSGGTFFLRVKGDSMIEAHIVEGDLALVKPQVTADNGEIVVAMINGEATLKRFYREKRKIRLQPENSLMEPIIVRPGKDDISIIGKVVGLYRRM